MEKYNIEKVWITDDAVWIRTADGREASEKFADYQRLRFATPEQRAQFTYDEYGIRWDEMDEDLSFHAFFRERKANPLYDLFIAHPELNASAIARRLGMSKACLRSTSVAASVHRPCDTRKYCKPSVPSVRS